MSLELLGMEDLGAQLPGALPGTPQVSPSSVTQTFYPDWGGWGPSYYPYPAYPVYPDYEPFDDVESLAEEVAEKLSEHVGAMAQGAHLPTWDEVRSPTKVVIMPHGAGSTVYGSGVARVSITGGKYWQPTIQANTNNWDNSGGVSPTATVYFTNRTRKTFTNLDAVSITGGRLYRGQNVMFSRYVVGAEYTDAFFAAKKELDDILTRSDSVTNAIQHAGVLPFLSKEATILEGFRRGVETKDKALVDSSTAAMKQLAAVARRFFINPTDGSVKSQTKEAATQTLVNAGGALVQFEKDVGDTVSWLKWGAIAAGVVAVLGVVGFWVIPFLRRR